MAMEGVTAVLLATSVMVGMTATVMNGKMATQRRQR